MGKKSNKGSAFERRVCKLLSRWFTRGERDDVFWRTAGSGGRATVRALKGKQTIDSAGDICAIDPAGKPLTAIASFELKKGYTSTSSSKGISILAFIDKLPNEKDPLLLRWAKKAQEEVIVHGRKFWFIIFERNRKQAVICMDLETFNYIDKRNPDKYIWPPFGPVGDVYINQAVFRFMLLDDFLEWCHPDSITRKIRRRGKPFPKKRWLAKYEPMKVKGKPIDQIQTEYEKKGRRIRRRK